MRTETPREIIQRLEAASPWGVKRGPFVYGVVRETTDEWLDRIEREMDEEDER